MQKITASRILGLILISAAVSVASITSKSLWVDELGTWNISQAAPWSLWAQKLWNHFNSDGQLPVYHAFIKLWVDAGGDNTAYLRASNTPWLLLTLLGLLRLPLKNEKTAWLVIFFFCINAFTWYYLNELRPYIILQAGAAWFLVGTWRLAISPVDDHTTVDTSTREILLGIVVMIAGNILGAFWIASTLLAFLIFLPASLLASLKSLARNWWLTLAFVVVLGGMLVVAMHSFVSGARASQLAEFSLAGFGYGLIELTGASGLGPSRHQLRTDIANISWAQVIAMASLAGLIGVLTFASWLSIPKHKHKLLILVAAVLPLLIMIGVGILLHWRVVGRHLSVTFPLIAIALAFFAARAFDAGGRPWRKILVTGITIGLLCSSLTIRLAERHEKDDYAQAAQWAKDALAARESVLWVAAPEGLAYYKVATSVQDIPATPLLYTYSDFQARMPPDTWPTHIVKTYREGVDPKGLTDHLLASQKYELVGKATTFEHFRIKTP
ncbi:MAG: hypothetical protein WAQ08_00365 [Aquabacterium sp.]|uniref:hypothetical protein n=1 Tax=Aquabacterium sp. TaxID=1872578 RepID=UPI003BAE7535